MVVSLDCIRYVSPLASSGVSRQHDDLVILNVQAPVVNAQWAPNINDSALDPASGRLILTSTPSDTLWQDTVQFDDSTDMPAGEIELMPLYQSSTLGDHTSTDGLVLAPPLGDPSKPTCRGSTASHNARHVRRRIGVFHSVHLDLSHVPISHLSLV